MLEGTNGQILPSIGTGWYWTVFRSVLKSNQAEISRICNACVASALDLVAQVPTNTITSQTLGRILGQKSQVDVGVLGTAARSINEKVTDSSLLGMLIWYALAEDRATTWRVAWIEEEELKTYQLLSDKAADAIEFEAWHKQRKTN